MAVQRRSRASTSIVMVIEVVGIDLNEPYNLDGLSFDNQLCAIHIVFDAVYLRIQISVLTVI